MPRLSDLLSKIDRLQQAVVLMLLVAVPVVFWRAPASSFQLPKFSLMVIGGIVALAAYIFRIAVTGKVRFPGKAPVIAVGFFLAAFVLAAVFSVDFWVSLFGVFNRWSGLLLYAAACMLFIIVGGTPERGWPRRVAGALLLGAGLTVSYAILQWVGGDPLDWGGLRGTQNVFSTQGNGNWLAAVSAIAIPLAIYFVVAPGHAALRALAGVYPLAAVLSIHASGSAQGWLVAIAGLGVMGVVALIGNADQRGRRRLLAALALAMVGVLIAVVVFFPRIKDRPNVLNRLYLWETAWAIAEDHPVVGAGPDTYVHHFYEHRPPEHAERFGNSFTDAPHNVPLAMLYGGGWLLGLGYVVFVSVVGWYAIRRLREADGPDLLFGAVVGAWVGYQLQSLISIDVPTLVLYHFTLAALIVHLGGGESPYDFALLRSAKGRSRTWLPVAPTAILLSLVAVVASWFALRPLRADLAAAHGARLSAAGQLDPAQENLEIATSLAPWQALYWQQLAVARNSDGNQEGALAALERAANVSPGLPETAHTVAEYADQLGQEEKAADWYVRAALRDPRQESFAQSAVEYLRSHGRASEAEALLERLEEVGS